MTSLSLCRLMPFEAVKAPEMKKGDVSVHCNSTQTHLLYYIMYILFIYKCNILILQQAFFR